MQITNMSIRSAGTSYFFLHNERFQISRTPALYCDQGLGKEYPGYMKFKPDRLLHTRTALQYIQPQHISYCCYIPTTVVCSEMKLMIVTCYIICIGN
jgi:hypothetical protein